MENEIVTTTSGKRAKIVVREVGQKFGCESKLVVRGKAIWTSRTFPYGCTGNAISAAQEAAKEL